jgi:hypothetical protein
MNQTSRTSRDRWRRVEQIYVEAVEREGDARATLLEHACGNDAVLRQDVESLLACQARVAQFIEGPALDVAAALLTNVSHAELVARTIGPYVIEAWLGSGGMGDVYRARDRQLNRQVALKILPDVFALDPDRLDRFKREAQVLASLNHPNIASIHGFEESDGLQALVLELIDGHTLADRLAHGPISIDEGLPIARQIAEGLEAAGELSCSITIPLIAHCVLGRRLRRRPIKKGVRKHLYDRASSQSSIIRARENLKGGYSPSNRRCSI